MAENDPLIMVSESRFNELLEKEKRYEIIFQKIVDMDSPTYLKKSRYETPYQYARVALALKLQLLDKRREYE